jgi:streptogramin lyase
MRPRIIACMALFIGIVLCAGCTPGGRSAGEAQRAIAPSVTSGLPSAGTVTATIQVSQSEDLYPSAADDTSIWLQDDDAGTLTRIDPHTNKVVARIHLPPPYCCIGASPGAVWVVSGHQNLLARIDPHTNRIVANIQVGPTPEGISYGDGSLWVCNHDSSATGLIRFDPQTNRVLAQVNLGSDRGLRCWGFLATNDTVWVVPQPDYLLERIDPATNEVVATIRFPVNLSDSIAADAHSVWVFSSTTLLGRIFRVDRQTNRIVGEIDIHAGIIGITSAAGSLWATTNQGTVLRITPVL